MEINTSLEKTRYLLNSSQERKKLIEDFVTFCNDRWDLLKERKYNILEFSNFLTFKGIMDWKDVTPSIIQSFIILNEENDTGSFELSEWIKSMNDFFTFLKDKNIVKDNPFSRSDILPKEDIEERLTPTKTCLRCGISLDSKIAKYCKQCSSQIKKEATLRWNKEHRERLRESNKRWRQRNPDRVKQLRLRYKLKNREKIREQNRLWKQKHPEKLREYREKYRKNKSRQFKKETLGIASGQKFFKEITASMSDWCKELRNTSIHLLWMKRQKKRIEKIRELENRFNCCWEDKFKEVYERYKHEEAAKILNLDYHTLFIWARHLKLQRLCIYCNKKLAIAEGTFHPECKIRYESTQKSPGIKELFSLIDPTLNISALNLKDENIRQVIEDVISTFPRKESLIIENRYLFLNRKQTLEELGSLLKVTRERVRQIEQKAIKKLSHPTRQKIIREKLSKLIFKDSTIVDSSLTGKINKLQIELNQLKQKLTGTAPTEISSLPLTEVELSVRAANCLENANIKTIGELANRAEPELLSLKNLGKKTLWELREILHSFGLKFNNEIIPSIYQKKKDKPIEIKKKCLFAGCDITPHKGKYCSKHKKQQRKLKAKEKCLHFGCNVIPRKGKYCSIHKPRKKKISIRRKCSFPGCETSPRKGMYCSRHKNYGERPIIKNKCLFPGCNVIPQKRAYCSKHKTSWQRRRALELLESKKETGAVSVSTGREHKNKYTIEQLKEIHSRLHPRG